ncbi:MAG: DUF86 domain-containing protein [Actinomycetia bacterium]|nr:DUF86 domain-containing protein [Actinomycetes bacterium]
MQVIGEAASRQSAAIIARYPAVPWRQVIGMRHRVVHDYFEIDLDILWHAVSVDVPRLGEEIGPILAELPEPES